MDWSLGGLKFKALSKRVKICLGCLLHGNADVESDRSLSVVTQDRMQKHDSKPQGVSNSKPVIESARFTFHKYKRRLEEDREREESAQKPGNKLRKLSSKGYDLAKQEVANETEQKTVENLFSEATDKNYNYNCRQWKKTENRWWTWCYSCTMLFMESARDILNTCRAMKQELVRKTMKCSLLVICHFNI